MLKVPCVAVIVLNPSAEILLILRDNEPHLEYPNHWTLPGGVAKSGESPEAAANREVREETGLTLELSHWKTYERQHQTKDLIVEQHTFTAPLQGGDQRIILGEGQEVRFFPHDEISQLQMAYGFGDLLSEFFRTLSIDS